MGFTDGIDRYRWFFEEYMNKDTIQDLREEINKMTALVNGFRKENEELKTENARLYLENEKLKEENKELRSDNCWITSEKKASKETNDMLAKKIIELKERNTELATKNGELLKGTLETKRKNLNLMKMNKELKEEDKKLYLIIEKLERDNQEVYDDYCEAKGENDELKEQVKCLAECCNKLNDDYCKLKKAKEVKVYKEFDANEFFKKFGANMEISLSPYTEPSITAYATDLNGVDLLRYSAEYTGRKFDDLFAPLYKYLASSPIERVVIAKELDKIREAYNNLEAKYQSAYSQISKYDEDLRDWKRQALKNADGLIKAKNTITTLNIQIEKLKGGFKEKDKCIERLRNELQKYEKSKSKQSEADARWEQMWDDYIK